MRHLIILIFLISYNSFGQSYSSNEIKNLVDSLYFRSTELHFIEDMNKPDTFFIVFNKWTSHVVYKQKSYVDNDAHRLFIRIVEKGNIQDLELMTQSMYPNIRVYGYWGLIKRKTKKETIKTAFNILANDNSKVVFNTFGDLNYTYEVGNLIKNLKKK